MCIWCACNCAFSIVTCINSICPKHGDPEELLQSAEPRLSSLSDRLIDPKGVRCHEWIFRISIYGQEEILFIFSSVYI